MNFYEIPGEGLIPTYVRNDFTDALQEAIVAASTSVTGRGVLAGFDGR